MRAFDREVVDAGLAERGEHRLGEQPHAPFGVLEGHLAVLEDDHELTRVEHSPSSAALGSVERLPHARFSRSTRSFERGCGWMVVSGTW